jgi:hypothetical protein
MTPLARHLLVGARVVQLKRDALAGALFPTVHPRKPRPRPVQVLPPSARLRRLVLAGVVRRHGSSKRD